MIVSIIAAVCDCHCSLIAIIVRIVTMPRSVKRLNCDKFLDIKTINKMVELNFAELFEAKPKEACKRVLLGIGKKATDGQIDRLKLLWKFHRCKFLKTLWKFSFS